MPLSLNCYYNYSHICGHVYIVLFLCRPDDKVLCAVNMCVCYSYAYVA